MDCPRCNSTALVFLFNQDRFTKGKYVYTWKYSECHNCALIITERVQNIGEIPT